MKALHKNEKGFTLVELMVVVVIIGVLIAIAIPIFNAVTERAQRGAIEANLRTIDGAIMMIQASEAEPVGGWTAGDIEGHMANYISGWPLNEPAGCTYAVVAVAPTFRAQVVIPPGVAGAGNDGTYTLAHLPWLP